MQCPQEHLKTIVDAKFGGQTVYSGAFENREYLLVVYEAEKYNAILQTQKKKERNKQPEV